MNKLYLSNKEALADLLKDDMTIMAGGSGLCRIPENLINAVKRCENSIVSNT